VSNVSNSLAVEWLSTLDCRCGQEVGSYDALSLSDLHCEVCVAKAVASGNLHSRAVTYDISYIAVLRQELARNGIE